MAAAEVLRKMSFMSMGAEAYEIERKSTFRTEFIRQSCETLKTSPQMLRRRDPEYYDIILANASAATDRMWEEEKKLIAKWEEQRRKIRESVTLS